MICNDLCSIASIFYSLSFCPRFWVGGVLHGPSHQIDPVGGFEEAFSRGAAEEDAQWTGPLAEPHRGLASASGPAAPGSPRAGSAAGSAAESAGQPSMADLTAGGSAAARARLEAAQVHGAREGEGKLLQNGALGPFFLSFYSHGWVACL